MVSDYCPFGAPRIDQRNSTFNEQRKYAGTIRDDSTNLNARYYDGGRGKSRIEGFQEHGREGREILGHPNFLKYLRYLIFGPDLPQASIDRFRQVLINDAGTSGMVLDQL